MKIRILFFMFLLAACGVKAQEFPSDLWHEGMLVLVNEDTLKGELQYNFERGLIQIKSANKTYTYSGNKVFYLQIYDETVDAYREFYTLPYALLNQHKTPVFFEVLVEGRLTLLCRESIVSKTINDPYATPSGSSMTYTRKMLIYTYYFLDEKGNITKYTLKKRDLMMALSKRSETMEEYIKANHLKADKRYDLTRIISFYNGII